MNPFLLVLSGLTLLVPFETPLSEPKFLLEQIEVVGNRLTTEHLIIEQSLLELTQSYSEQELSLAMARINRLPFVLDTQFSLEKGDNSRTFRLVIQIKESQRVFLDFNTGYYSQKDSPNDYGFDSLNIGLRHFFTANLMVFGGYRPKATLSNERHERESYALGMTYYNLFKPGASLNFIADVGDGTVKFRNFDQTQREMALESDLFQLNYSLPLQGNHRLVTILNYGDNLQDNQLSARFNPTRTNWFLIHKSESIARSLQTYWEWNSVDDNFAPNSGFRLQSGLMYGTNDLDISRLLPEQGTGVVRDHDVKADERNIGINLSYDHYWNFKNRHVLFFNVGAMAVKRSGTVENEPYLVFPRELDDPLAFEFRNRTIDTRWHTIDLSVGYAYKLWNKGMRDRYGDLRLEFRLSDGVLRFDSDSGVFHRDSQMNLNSGFGENQRSLAVRDGRAEQSTVLETTLKFRNEWGVIRGSLRYDLNH